MRLGEEYVELYRSLVLLDFYFHLQNRIACQNQSKQGMKIFRIIDIFVDCNKISFKIVLKNLQD